MIPIYIGVGDEANQGLCTGTENYWCVNKTAAPEDIQATLDFLYWCVTSDEGTACLADDMGFVIPFNRIDSTPKKVKLLYHGTLPQCLPRSGRTALVLL